MARITYIEFNGTAHEVATSDTVRAAYLGTDGLPAAAGPGPDRPLQQVRD